MFDGFIKNTGITQTIIQNNNKKYYNEIDWDTDYDGEVAKISLNIDENGVKNSFNAEMTNDEISELLNIPSVNIPLEKRLKNDFFGRNVKNLDDLNMIILRKKPKTYPKNSLILDNLNDYLPEKDVYTHISSPSLGENLIFPIQIQETKRHKKTSKSKKSHKTHKTHKSLKSHKSHKSSSISLLGTRRTNKGAKYSRHTF